MLDAIEASAALALREESAPPAVPPLPPPHAAPTAVASKPTATPDSRAPFAPRSLLLPSQASSSAAAASSGVSRQLPHLPPNAAVLRLAHSIVTVAAARTSPGAMVPRLSISPPPPPPLLALSVVAAAPLPLPPPPRVAAVDELCDADWDAFLSPTPAAAQLPVAGPPLPGPPPPPRFLLPLFSAGLVPSATLICAPLLVRVSRLWVGSPYFCARLWRAWGRSTGQRCAPPGALRRK